MNYSTGLEVISGLDKPAPANVVRAQALQGIAFLVGGILGVRAWPAHKILGFILGSSLGSYAATVVTGKNVWEDLTRSI